MVGVRIGDMGVDKNGKPKANFQPGMDIRAKVTVLGEGVRGTPRQAADRALRARRATNPQVYETGHQGDLAHQAGEARPGPRRSTAWLPEILPNVFGGMWLYDMKDNLVSFGFVTLLDSTNPYNDPHLEAQRFKTNPWMRELLEGAELVRYGAKTIPIGGLYAQPKLYVDGALLVGDAAGFCNAQKLAGVHMAMKIGHAGRRDDRRRARAATTSPPMTLGGYTERYRQSWAYAGALRRRATSTARLGAGLAVLLPERAVPHVS